MPETVVRYGLISTAQIGLNAHVPAARESANSEIVAVSSRTEQGAREAAAAHGIPRWYGTYEDMLADPDLDAVINTLPNSMHCEWTIKAAEAGKHILCEKPLAASVAEARLMIDAANKNGVLLVEAFTPRWNPQMRAVRRMIADGTLGEVTSLESSLSFCLTDWVDNVRVKAELAGGSLMDAGCYPLYAVRFAMGAEPVKVAGIAHSRSGCEVDSTFSALLEFPSGAVAHITSSMEQVRRSTLDVYGTKGQASILNTANEQSPVVITTDDGRRTEEMSGPPRFRVQLDDFSECVLTGRTPEFPPEDALRNTCALVALLRAADEGVTVEVEQV